jgi:LPS sulfotransferase NodH
MTPFVILGTQRTGTTWLATLLDAHREVRCYGEAFKSFESRSKVDVGDSGYLHYRQATWRRRLRHLLQRRASVDAYLDELYAPPAAQVQAVGFKLMLNQGTRNAAVLDYLLARGARGIAVFRENSLQTLVSRLSARQSGTFHSTEKVAARPVVVAVDDLLQRLASLDAERTAWSERLGARMTLHRVSYEQLAGDPNATMAGVFGFLGVSVEPVTARCRRSAPTTCARELPTTPRSRRSCAVRRSRVVSNRRAARLRARSSIRVSVQPA